MEEERKQKPNNKASPSRLNDANLPCDGSHRRSNFGSRIAAMTLDDCSICGVAVVLAVYMNSRPPNEGAVVRLFDASLSGSTADSVG